MMCENQLNWHVKVNTKVSRVKDFQSGAYSFIRPGIWDHSEGILLLMGLLSTCL